MIKKLGIQLRYLILLLIIVTACDDSSIDPIDPDQNSQNDSTTIVGACEDFAYTDSIFFLRDESGDFIVSPVNDLDGLFGAYPLGLEIDSLTGDINVTQSETGLQYQVFYIPEGTSDTCKTEVIISGIDYRSGIYSIDANDTLAVPIYNASDTLALPCSDDDDDDYDDDNGDDDESDNEDEDGNSESYDDDGCEFDDGPDDDDGDGDDDEPAAGEQVRPQGVEIDTTNGILNLKQTVLNGAFGANPVSGSSNLYKINYRLNDASNKALNSIDVELHYFETEAEIPQELLDKAGAGNRISNQRLAGFEFEAKRRRPVIIIIVGIF